MFAEGQGSPTPRLNANTVKKILRKSVATILAHIGYDSKLIKFVSLLFRSERKTVIHMNCHILKIMYWY